MRLIDADKMEKQWTIASPEPYNTDVAEVLESIRDAQTIDAVPVVRCQECKHARKSEKVFDFNGGTPLCECAYMTLPHRWHEFCSFGE
jgi:hypothetical protein